MINTFQLKFVEIINIFSKEQPTNHKEPTEIFIAVDDDSGKVLEKIRL